MKTASCKEKARSLQNPIAGLIRMRFDLGEADCRPATMGVNGIDIQLSSAAREFWPFATECKKQENLSIWDALKQCETNAIAEGLYPLLVFSKNRSKAYAAAPLDLFMWMVRHWTEGENPWPFTLWMRNGKSIPLWRSIKEAEALPHRDLHPLLIIQRADAKAYAIVEFSVFLEMAEAFVGGERPWL